MHFIKRLIKRLIGSPTKLLNRETHRAQPFQHSSDRNGYACILSVTCEASDSLRLEKAIGIAAEERQLTICSLHKLPLPDSALLQLVAYVESPSDTRAQLVKMVHWIAIDRAVRAVRWERLPRIASPADRDRYRYPAHIETRTRRAHLKRLAAFDTAARARPAAGN